MHLGSNTQEKINEILIKKTNIIEIDNWLGGFDSG